MIDPNHPATANQIHAATPHNSSWVSANAGSGKTRVLTDRVARLLLRGTQPARILCLTYTKAAAAEMQKRLFDRLGEWAMMQNDDLRHQLRQLGEESEAIETQQLRHARTLFARALETPGGLKIQTIHAFCEQLLRRFPLESAVAPQFEVMEDRQAAQLRQMVVEEMAMDPASGFEQVVPHLPQLDPAPVLEAVLRHREHFAQPPDEAALRQCLGATGPVGPADRVAAILHSLPTARLEAAIEAMAAVGGAQETKAVAALRRAKVDPAAAFDDLRAVFLTQEGQPRKAGMPTKKTTERCPDAAEDIPELARAVQTAEEARRADAALLASLALGRFGHGFLARYTAKKSTLGKLDFDDLIARAKQLLSQADAAAWVQYRMDGGIDHILVDEAQDTSLDQWAVIDALAADFFTGESARAVARTIFVVGDEKQSIYSFQGADPAAFGDQRQQYGSALDAATRGLEECDLLYSFRSAAPILDLVDRVYSDNPAHGLGDAITHRAFHSDKPGRVDLWPFIDTPDKPEPDPWHLPVDQPPADDPALVLARQIAAHIAQTLASGMALPGTGRAISGRDFLILVRSRSKLFHATIRELKAAGVPVAGADRLKVGGELAVKDLLAVLRFIATEVDDLSLASALRSPLFGLSQSALHCLAAGREGTLWQALQQSHEHTATCAVLNDLRAQADFLRPFELLERLLVRHDKWRAITARLGAEAEDGIEALLDLALSYERIEAPNLTGFLQWMDSEDVEIKRRLDDEQDHVRVMTVHGAKGLEAPIVILPETQKTSDSRQPPVLLEAGLGLLRMSKGDMPATLRATDDTRKRLEQEERWRLLYVALTRAESWLIIAGGGTKGDPRNGWYAAVEAAMNQLGAAPDEAGLTLRHNWTETPAETTDDAAHPVDEPAWLFDRAGPPEPAVVPIAPSREGGAVHALSGDAGDETEAALDRGRNLHLLLEAFAAAPDYDRSELAQEILPDTTDAERNALRLEAENVVSAPDLRWIFAPEALTEVPVRGSVTALGPRPIRGQIDRLIPGDEIWAIDFKSNRTIPKRAEDIPEGLIGQLALYKAALSDIWPDRPVRTGIVWTFDASFMELPQITVSEWLQSRWQG